MTPVLPPSASAPAPLVTSAPDTSQPAGDASSTVDAAVPADQTSTASGETAQSIEHLRELIIALDRRVTHIERTGELEIARDAAQLKDRALKRIAELAAAAHAKG
jgi:hypothetical protein